VNKKPVPSCGSLLRIANAEGIPESSRGLSEAIPPGTRRPPGDAPRKGCQTPPPGTNPLPPLSGVDCFLDHVPVVSPCSTIGYFLCSLREQCPCAPLLLFSELPLGLPRTQSFGCLLPLPPLKQALNEHPPRKSPTGPPFFRCVSPGCLRQTACRSLAGRAKNRAIPLSPESFCADRA
jgi:hypothetical protein